jgi:hypothetical protein
VSLRRKLVGLRDTCRESGGSDGAGQQRSGDCFLHGGFLFDSLPRKVAMAA